MVDMLKIWGKTYDGEKITRTKVIEFESAHIIFYDMVKTVCEKLDIATPVCLNKHYEDFMQFKTCFLSREILSIRSILPNFKFNLSLTNR